ncbi:hypothetical protein BGW42_000869 [Actinomortierella wolfii]|nr:hypothetical protein BGW42_000869 [Actinomortierella wolfii]
MASTLSPPSTPPTLDEDYDLCISETNLPFPYSDHCGSTGPSSLYEYDVGEREEEEEEIADEDHQEGEEDMDEIVHEVEDLDDRQEYNAAISVSHLKNAYGTRSARSSTELQRELSDRLSMLKGSHTRSFTQESIVPRRHPRTLPPPPRSRQSFESVEWLDSGYPPALEQQEQLGDEADMYHGDDEDDQAPRGLLHNATSAVTSVMYNVGRHWSKKIYDSLQRSRDPKAYYSHLLKAATNYEQWSEAAVIMDRLQGKDAWKNNPVSPHYDYELLQERLDQLVAARQSGDLGSMIFLLRTSLARNLGNVGRPELYDKTIIGTKRLIEDYNSEVIRQLNIICDTESDDFPMASKLEFFTHTRQAFGRTALLLSGGATMGLIHLGVIKSLWENQLLPRIISGSSCGSIIAAILCTRTDEEIPSMFQFEKFNFTVFTAEEEKGDYMARILHFLKHGALFDNKVLREALKQNIGNVTFQEAYNRTRRVLNITVSTSGTFDMPRLLNYLTAPNVLIWSAVATSCGAPGVFAPSQLYAKDTNGDVVPWSPSKHHWIDGSVENDLPMNRLAELFNVNHSIVCQVNPYVVPFLQNALARSPANRILGWMFHQARSEIQHRLNQLSILGVTPRLVHKTQAIMAQRYDGDITIVPQLDHNDFLKIVSNPTVDTLVVATLKGERATWPKISIIKNHCSIEHCIDDILYRLRLRRLEAFRAYPMAGPSAASSSSSIAKTTAATTLLTVNNGTETNGPNGAIQHPPLKNSTSASVVPTTTLRGSVSTTNFHSMRTSSSPTSPTAILITPPALEMSRIEVESSADNSRRQDKTEGRVSVEMSHPQSKQPADIQVVVQEEESGKSTITLKKTTTTTSSTSSSSSTTATPGTNSRRNSGSSTKSHVKSGSAGATAAKGSSASGGAAVVSENGIQNSSTLSSTSSVSNGSTTRTNSGNGSRRKKKREIQMTSMSG